MIRVAVYSQEDGQIGYVLVCSILDLSQNVPSGCGAIEIGDNDPTLVMVDLSTSPVSLKPKPTFSLQSGSFDITYPTTLEIPPGTSVFVYFGEQLMAFFVAEESVEFEVDEPGIYRFVLEKSGFVTKEVYLEGINQA